MFRHLKPHIQRWSTKEKVNLLLVNWTYQGWLNSDIQFLLFLLNLGIIYRWQNSWILNVELKKNMALNISFLSYRNDKYTFKKILKLSLVVQVETFSPSQILLLKSSLYCRFCVSVCICVCLYILIKFLCESIYMKTHLFFSLKQDHANWSALQLLSP